MRCHRYLTTLFVLFPVLLWGEVLYLTEPGKTFFLNDYLEIVSSDANADLQSIEQSNDFIPFSSWSAHFKAEQYYWGKIQCYNQLPQSNPIENWILEFPNQITFVEVFVKGLNGVFKKSTTGTFVPLKDRSFNPTPELNLVKISFPSDQITTVYFRAISERAAIPPAFELQLQSSDSFFTALNKKKQWSALFLGFVLMMLVYNLILYFLARDKAYLYYSAYLFSMAMYTAYVLGDLGDVLKPLLFPNQPQYIYYFIKLAVYLGIFSYINFIRSFLDLDRLLPKWDRSFKYLMIVGVPLLLLDLSLVYATNYSYTISDWITLPYSMVFVLVSFIFLWPLSRTNDEKRYFIIIGLLMMGIGIIITILLRIQSPDYTILFFEIGSILEILVFSLGLAYRRKQNEHEKQQTYFELEKSKMIQAQKQEEAKQLNALAELKSNFYTNITHEFRTPLTVIIGMLDNIKGHTSERKLIRRNSQNLLHLVNQLLDLSKIDSGNIKMEEVQGDIVYYLRYLTESFYSLAREKEIRLTFYSEGEEEVIMDFDEVKIQQIVYNLLSNAIKFTPPKGEIIFHVQKIIQQQDAFLQIKVQDTGAGIPADQLSKIFDRFYQVDILSPRTGGGTGIGLSLIQELVTIMGGEIKVNSVLKKGSEFTLLLPIKKEAKTHFVNYKENRSLPSLNVPAREETIAEYAADALATTDKTLPLLLIIEDNADVITYIESILKKDYQIETASDGQIGIDKALEIIPDIIITDVMMPEKDGYEVSTTLKNDERTSHIPIVMLTAKATAGDRITGLKTGADAYLMKPFDKQELLVRLEQLIALRKALQERYAQTIISLNPSTVEAEKTPDLNDIFLQKIQNVIDEKMGDSDLGIIHLCQAVQRSHTQVYRKMKALTGEHPTGFIRKRRLHKAKELLQSTGLNVSEIAYQVGFTDPNHFSRLFSKEFGVPPSTIHKQL